MSCYEDETFGPVLSAMRVATYHEALRLINQNPYANGTAVFTRDGGAARQFQSDVDPCLAICTCTGPKAFSFTPKL
jgi:malonate-semialdehyde dehydrogenase (acetylating) / methylmalonate-semialdehyde dehydrogenase